MSKHKHHNENAETNKVEEPKKDESIAEPKAEETPKPTIEELLKQIAELNTIIYTKEQHISKLQEEINAINADYVNKVTAKANEANAMLKTKIEELNTKAASELANYKKYAIEKQAVQLIDIINQFDLALSYTPKDEKIMQYQAGFKMFLTMFKTLLNDLSINEIVINVGDEFNPQYMECIEFVHADNIDDNKVAKVVTKGYKLHDRIIKVATVNVVKKKN